MNRFTPRVPIVLVLSTLSSVALAADNVAPATTPSPASSAPAATTAAPAPAATAATTPAPRSADPAVRRLACLNMSLQCFAVKAPPPESKPKPALDLRAPDIHRIVSEVQLREPVEEPQVADDEQEQVQVQGSRPEVDVPLGIASLPWAVMHPAQAWRILLPVPPGAAK
ncbi:MAG: hypothetical protein WDO56_34505 [Gammaproteobacteria bacterium]